MNSPRPASKKTEISLSIPRLLCCRVVHFVSVMAKLSKSDTLFPMKTSFQKDSLNPEFLKNLNIYFGSRAKKFLTELPDIILSYEAAWNIKVLKPFPNLSVNYVAPAVGLNGEAYVFKCGVPNSEFETEIDALTFMDGVGLPRLIHASKEDAVLLQERISPGVSLRRELQETKMTDAEATEIAALLMKDYFQQAARPIPESLSFPHISDWLQAFERKEFNERCDVFPKELLERIDVLLPDLLASQQSEVLLHGDLHHDNIVSKGLASKKSSAWMVIDPKGIRGEPSYEIGAFLRNPHELVEDADLKSTTLKRIDIFSHVLEIESERIAAWMIVQAVLSVWWSIAGDETIQSSNDFDAWSKTVLEAALSVTNLV